MPSRDKVEANPQPDASTLGATGPARHSPALTITNHGLRNSGGIERYALTLVRGLHARGVRPTFIAKVFDSALPEYAWVRPIQVRMTGIPNKLRDLVFDWRIGRIKRRLGLFPLIACNQTHSADIAICGSVHPGYLAAMGQRASWSDGWRTRLEHRHLTNAQFVVAHSRRMADEAVLHHAIRREKIKLIYPPVDCERFHAVDARRRSALRNKFDLPADRAVFLLASTGHKRKGLDLLLEYFGNTPLPVCLAVAGRPVPGAPAHVRYLGYRNDIEDVFRAVDFTVVASRYEPFGLVGVESVLCGTPLVLADNVGCAEVIGAAAQLPFSLDHDGSLGSAITEAVQRWRDGTHRLKTPLACLRYDPSVAAHLDALLGLVDCIAPQE
jgi:glycosyltransferase involved in cell wall biosynthesis